MAKLSPNQRLVLRSAGIVLALGFVAVAIAAATGNGASTLFGTWIYCGVMVGAAASCLARAVLVRRERAAWLLIGAGLLFWTGGEIYYLAAVSSSGSVPVPSPADAGYLLLYPLTYAGLIVLLRERIGSLPATRCLDGLIAGLAVAALTAALALGPIAAVVSAAGLLLFQPDGQRPLIKSTPLDTWERSFAVNTRGVFLCARAYIRHRESRPVAGGRFITFSSVAAQLGGYRSSASYIAAKSAVLGLTKAMAREVSRMGITVNSVSPGLIDTDMLRATVSSGGALRDAAEAIPLGRIGTPDDVADAVGFLASPQSGYITGSVIDVNGGYRMQ